MGSNTGTRLGGFLFDWDIYMDGIVGAEYEKESLVLRRMPVPSYIKFTLEKSPFSLILAKRSMRVF
jgi:hypothetical protein